MLFTIVTPSLNCKEFILENIRSVRKQGFGPDQLEHWVIDGGSKDGTLEILTDEPDIKWISERDRGLSDAVNKGIQKASGEWIIWLNADDMLANNALKIFVEYVQKHPSIKVFSGDEAILGFDGTVEQVIKGWDYKLEDLLGMNTSMNQASTFVHRDVYAKAGLLDVTIRYAMDYEWLVRAMHHYRCIPIPHILTHYRRRKGSIMDAHMAAHYQEFLRQRRKYRKSKFSWAELRIRFYIYTDCLRRITWMRRTVRQIKKVFGCEPKHRI